MRQREVTRTRGCNASVFRLLLPVWLQLVQDERLLRWRARLSMSTPEHPVEVPGQLQDRAAN